MADEMVEEQPALSANQFTNVVQELISAEFKIDSYNIASNGQKHMVLVQNSELQTISVFSVPKMDQNVYLVAQIYVVTTAHSSKANIFFDGSYIGETYIDLRI